MTATGRHQRLVVGLVVAAALVSLLTWALWPAPRAPDAGESAKTRPAASETRLGGRGSGASLPAGGADRAASRNSVEPASGALSETALAYEVPPEWPLEQVVRELGAARQRLAARQRMVERIPQVDEELETSNAREQIRDEFDGRADQARRRLQRAEAEVAALELRLQQLE